MNFHFGGDRMSNKENGHKDSYKHGNYPHMPLEGGSNQLTKIGILVLEPYN